MYKFKVLVLSAFILLFAFSVNAQVAPSEKSIEPTTSRSKIDLVPIAQDFKLRSKLMNREMPYRVIFPVNYESSTDKRFPVVYLIHGLFGHFNNWADKSKLLEYAKDYNLIIVMPEGNNGWYTDNASVPNDRYETYIANELITEVDGKFRTMPDREHRVIGGLSMGGYGALKFGLKYPEKFILAGSFSGAVQIASYKNKEELPKGMLRDSVISTFGDVDTATKQSNDIFKIVDEMKADKAAKLPFLYLSCGTEDELGLLAGNRLFADSLTKQKIPHEFRELPGKHNWAFWDDQVDEFLRLSKRFIKV
jgi:putative tributyrin esterase